MQSTSIMQSALRIKTKVLPGNKLEIELPPGSEGEEVDVFVVLPEKLKVQRENILEFIKQARSQYAVRTVEEIDRQLQAEREAWDS